MQLSKLIFQSNTSSKILLVTIVIITAYELPDYIMLHNIYIYIYIYIIYIYVHNIYMYMPVISNHIIKTIVQ